MAKQSALENYNEPSPGDRPQSLILLLQSETHKILNIKGATARHAEYQFVGL